MPFLLRISSLITAFLAKGFNLYYLDKMITGLAIAPRYNFPLDLDYIDDIFFITSVFLKVG